MSDEDKAGKVTVSLKGRSEPEYRERLPRENLVRALDPSEIEVREAEDGPAVMRGHFSVFNEWTEIRSRYEGNFMERISPGAYDKTFAENRASMRVLFDHGKDPQIGNKVLGPIDVLRPDERGAYYEVPLFDTSYNKDLLPGLKAGSYGSSMRFQVLREKEERSPDPSEPNPLGLPERTILEAKVLEFGPVTFPAYPGATAGVRSMTDDYLLQRLYDDPEKLAEALLRLTGQNAPSKETPAPATSPERRVVNRKFNSREDYLEWLNFQS